MRSRLDPLKKFVRMMRRRRDLVLNRFEANKELDGGIVDGMNDKARTRIKTAYGYRKTQTLVTAPFHQDVLSGRMRHGG
jgi:transposase